MESFNRFLALKGLMSIASGGGSSKDVRYVTFLSEDGTTELYKKAVAVGDDCADIIARGLIEPPTKDSTEQYNYTFSGWSTTSGGAASGDALASVTADRTVYAAFATSTRYYTVRFFDGDTLVDTVQVPYGGTAVTNYEKDGYSLVAWTPSNVGITADTDCYGEWIEGVTIVPFIEKTLSGYYTNDRVTSLGTYSLSAITSDLCVCFPSVTTTGTWTFYQSTGLRVADFSKLTTIDGSAFRDCTGLTAVIIRGTTVCELKSASGFKDSSVSAGTGYIYVPADLVDSYKAATNWSTFAGQIRAIEDYPEITGG